MPRAWTGSTGTGNSAIRADIEIDYTYNANSNYYSIYPRIYFVRTNSYTGITQGYGSLYYTSTGWNGGAEGLVQGNTSVTVPGAGGGSVLYWSGGYDVPGESDGSTYIWIRMRGTRDPGAGGQNFLNFDIMLDFTLNNTPIPVYNSTNASEITGNSARLRANITSLSAITGGGWDLTTLPGKETWTYYPGGPTDLTVTGLNKNTLYYFRGYAVNSAGGANSGWDQFTTVSNPPQLSSISIDAIGRTSMTSSFTVEDNGGQDPTSKSITIWDNENMIEGEGIEFTTDYSGTATGLIPYKQYWIKGKATNNGGTSYTEPVTFRTTGNDPIINNVDIDATQTNATFAMDISFDGEDKLGYFNIEYGLTEDYGNVIELGYDISDLEPNTQYYYKVSVKSFYDEQKTDSITGVFKTDYPTQQIKSFITQFTLSDTAGVKVNVDNPSWIEEIRVWFYDKDETYIINQQNKTSNIASENLFEIQELEPNTQYIGKSQIVTKGGYESEVVEIIFVTAVDQLIKILQTDGTVSLHNMYVLGEINKYDASILIWENGFYDALFTGVTLNSSINNSGNGAYSTNFITVEDKKQYTFTNEHSNVTMRIVGTNNSDIISISNIDISPGTTRDMLIDNDSTTNKTNRLYISLIGV